MAEALPRPLLPPVETKPTRRETVEYLKALYQKEQLTRELDLEQLRYGRSYWEPEHSGPELAGLQRARDVMLRQLTAEANQVLTGLFPGEAGEPVALTAIFDANHAGPNLTFLSLPSRQRFEAEMLTSPAEQPPVDAALLLTLAERILPPEEMDSYRQWNDPSAAALRNQLVAFNPTEGEFVAILSRTRATEASADVAGTGSDLELQLGRQRLAEFRKLQDPAMQGAVHDLYRLGRPLEDAEWLASTRARAIDAIQQTWRSDALTDLAKNAQVSQLQRNYGQTIAAKLSLPESTLDEITPTP